LTLARPALYDRGGSIRILSQGGFMRPALLATLFLVACGGGGAKYKVDDVALASIPLDEKKPIFQAEHEVSLAKAEAAQSIADTRDTEGQLDIADKEQEQAKLETQKAKLSADQAEKSHDLNRVSAAQKELHIAEVGERAATAKTDWLSKKKKWHKELGDVAEAHVEAATSKVELEKARLAAAKGIKPTADFKLDDFAADYAKHVKEWQEEQQDAQKLKTQVDKLEQTYNGLKAQYANLRAPASAPSQTAPASYTPPAQNNAPAPVGDPPGAAPPSAAH
jgi:hypothetical protein